MTGLDNGAGSLGRDGTLQDSEVLSSNFVCNPNTSHLQVYNSSQNPVYQLIEVIDLSDKGGSGTFGSYEKVGLLVKSLQSNNYAIYYLGMARRFNGTTSGMPSTTLTRANTDSDVYYTSNDCTGQGYLPYNQPSIPQWISTLMLNFTNFSLSYGTNTEIAAMAPFKAVSAGRTFASKGLPGSCYPDSSGESLGLPVTVRASTFVSSIDAGWYIAP
jgi:hypothetical protein